MKLHLDARREGRSASSAQAGVGHLLDDVVRLHLSDGFIYARVSAVRDVLVDVSGGGVACVSERDAMLSGYPRHVAEIRSAVNRIVSQVAEDFVGRQLAECDVRTHYRGNIFRSYVSEEEP